jgi:hypothetical protein
LSLRSCCLPAYLLAAYLFDAYLIAAYLFDAYLIAAYLLAASLLAARRLLSYCRFPRVLFATDLPDTDPLLFATDLPNTDPQLLPSATARAVSSTPASQFFRFHSWLCTACLPPTFLLSIPTAPLCRFLHLSGHSKRRHLSYLIAAYLLAG